MRLTKHVTLSASLYTPDKGDSQEKFHELQCNMELIRADRKQTCNT